MEAVESPSSVQSSPPVEPPLDPSLVTASQPYIGQWNRLVSTTNWQKGRIIGQWRASLAAQGLAAGEFADEAWARLVGGVTGQHVGRLRRVFARFGEVHEQYPGLYWSHFQAALDWNDAEMWLEGAVASGWSVARMRDERWQTLGKLESERPQKQDIVAAETDEDFEPARTSDPARATITSELSDVQLGPRLEGPDFGDEAEFAGNSQSAAEQVGGDEPAALVQPFAHLPELPDDLAEAFDALKLAILRHKQANWSEISLSDVLRTLDALKALATAPSGDAPF
ncbi:MAG: hypothetical protein L0211_15145 [Planctomycetaceae bacterium]|nr:hypothetical protein [Planctomycetaceae bacterium]